MNIFFLHHDPKICAQYHHDKHVVKMIVETAQLLCSAHRILDGEMYYDFGVRGQKIKRWRMLDEQIEIILYKATHVNHPSNIWARTSHSNYIWLYELFESLSNEYTHRYGKVHASWSLLGDKLKATPNNINLGPMTKIPQAMPDIYKNKNPIVAYCNYYVGAKKSQSKYTNRDIPRWML